jgi:hypothetical protein
MAQRRVAEQRVDRGQAGVAGAHTVVTVGFEVVEKRTDQGGIDIVKLKPGRGLAGAMVGESEQQPEGIPVGADRVGAGVSLGDEPLDEERLQRVPRG